MDGSHLQAKYPVVLRFEGLFPSQLAGYEMHRTRKGGDVGHVDEGRSHLNRRLIGDADWAQVALDEIATIKATNFAEELEALEKRKRVPPAKRSRLIFAIVSTTGIPHSASENPSEAPWAQPSPGGVPMR